MRRIEERELFGEQETPEGACPPTDCSPSYLKARAEIAGDLYREGKVTRPEAWRMEVDQACGTNTGPLVMEDNDDHQRMMEESEEYRRREAKRQANTKDREPEA